MTISGSEAAVSLDNSVRQQRASHSIREIGRYQHWSQQLIELLRIMDGCKPHTYRQWWHDDRDNQQRTAILVGVAALLLTAFFSLVQAILTGLQLRKG